MCCLTKARGKRGPKLGFSSWMCALEMAPRTASEEFAVFIVNLVLYKMLPAAKYPGLVFKEFISKVL